MLLYKTSKYISFAIKGVKLFNNNPESIYLTQNRFNFVIKRMASTSAVETEKSNSIITKIHNNIFKPQPDNRLYRGIELQNGIKCLLISDPTTDKSAASVDVHIGSLVDPIPGLAHFCEHMLFLGSSKYPQENTFAKFIEDHAGSSNAFTASENTNYHFEISTSHLKEALDIFSQFFISPLFDIDSVDREINAVNSENNKNLQSDAWRLDQLDKSTSRLDHPYSNFGTGNTETLKTIPTNAGISIRSELIKFHSKYYSSNLMTMCILGAESLDILQSYVEEMFATVPNKNTDKIVFKENPYSDESLGCIHYVVPVQDLHYLTLSFPLPDYRDHYESNPGHYVSHLIGHEGPGSLLSDLKAKGWCNGLYSGPKSGGRGFSFFTISLDLSDEGIEHVDEIIKLCFQYINLLKTEGPKEWIQNELAEVGKMNFTYKDKEKPVNFVSHLAGDLHVFKMEHALCGNYFTSKYEPNLIKEILNNLKPESMKILAVSKKYDGNTDQIEKWYGTKYRVEKINEDKLNELKNCGLNEAFKLPPKNDFVPTDFSLVKHENGVDITPVVIKKTPITRIWYKGDDKFLLPKASIRFEFRSPLAFLNPKHFNMTTLFIDLLCDSLNEYTYAAELAGLRYRVNQSNYGIEIHVNGFNNKMSILVDKIVKRMAEFKVDEKRFNVLKESLKRNLQNFQAQQPYHHALYYMQLLLVENGFSKDELLQHIEDFTVKDLQEFIPKYFTEGLYIESVVFGNLSKEDALRIFDNVETHLQTSPLLNAAKLKPLLPCQRNNFRHIQLENKSESVFIHNNKIHQTIGIEAYYQSNQSSTRNNAIIELFCQIISEPTYNVLRTQEQLGYIVASGIRRFNGMQGVRFILQSDKQPDNLDERIENFIKSISNILSEMSDEELKRHVDALVVTKLEDPKKISKQCDIYWGEILSHQYNFEREKIEVEELRKLTKDDIIEFYKNYICESAQNRRKLAVYVNPPDFNEELKNRIKKPLISDITQFKAGLSLCPLPKPFINVD